MPAVTVDDLLVLPKVTAPDPGAAERAVVSVTTAPPGVEGEGFPVYRAFAGVAMTAIDPFVHMDQMGEVDYAPGEPKGTHGIPTAGSRPSPTSSTGSSIIKTPTAVVGGSPTATPSG